MTSKLSQETANEIDRLTDLIGVLLEPKILRAFIALDNPQLAKDQDGFHVIEAQKKISGDKQ